ncbi:MAG: putative periplasmic protein kinase ArgK and related GTPases of G3E family [uncultured Acidimicrobiales bacterium]|uniref:Putative periplasmic protein kinase ArgK and related GTPases of G3E family n=1 Tax=uncultured Acidimicrobiales bacterium TaxID=310071 RepID=A0A6J4GY84_9ACTN|nr:MAG: putative periplasmic protein kinase ArgK and related GTPases of G3E family [uncultured Acidimicrobiales bacterium]
MLVEAAGRGDRGAVARLLSLVERGGEGARSVGRLTYPHGGRTYTVGITGAPGAGKSSLTNRVIEQVRAAGSTVAVLAIDPSSPFTGGAILGDRVRMQDHALDDGVFIRSMATRGHLGGLSLATPEAVRVLDAAGVPLVIIETVGVGQVEVEVAGAADTTVVVVNPGWGDAVQANKAGLLEIADIFVINKADRPGALDTQRDLEQMLELTTEKQWRPPIVHTKAVDNDGADRLLAAIADHRAHLESTGELVRRRARRLEQEMREIIARSLEQRAYELASGDAFAQLLGDVLERTVDPWTAAGRLIEASR